MRDATIPSPPVPGPEPAPAFNLPEPGPESTPHRPGDAYIPPGTLFPPPPPPRLRKRRRRFPIAAGAIAAVLAGGVAASLACNKQGGLEAAFGLSYTEVTDSAAAAIAAAV